MSMSFRGYCIKIADLQSLVENPPPDLHNEIRERLNQRARLFDPKAPDQGPSTRAVLVKFLKLESEGILLEQICAVRGVQIETVFFDDVKIMSLYRALEAGMGGGVCEQLKEPRLPVPLPPPKDGGLPWISYLTLQEIKDGLARPDKNNRKLDNWVADARDELRIWLETAQEHGTDLVVFGT
jgi:hypothetical protein